MLNLLVVSGHEVVFLELIHYFYSNNFVTNNVFIKNWQALTDINEIIVFDVIIIDCHSKIPIKDIFDYCKQNNPECLVYGMYESFNEILVSEFTHKGAYSFIVRNNLSGMVFSIRKIMNEKVYLPSFANLEGSHHFLSSCFEQAIDPIWVKDRYGKYLLINPAGARFIAKPIHEIIGKYDHEIFPQDTAEKIRKSDCFVIQTGNTVVVEDSLANCDEITHVFQAVKSVFRDRTGEAQGLIGTVRDLTALKQEMGMRKDPERRFSLLIQNVKAAALQLLDHDVYT